MLSTLLIRDLVACQALSAERLSAIHGGTNFSLGAAMMGGAIAGAVGGVRGTPPHSPSLKDYVTPVPQPGNNVNM